MTPNELIVAGAVLIIVLLAIFALSPRPNANRTMLDPYDIRCKHRWEKCGTVFHNCGNEVLAGRTYRLEQFCYKEVCTKCGCRARRAVDKPERREIF